MKNTKLFRFAGVLPIYAYCFYLVGAGLNTCYIMELIFGIAPTVVVLFSFQMVYDRIAVSRYLSQGMILLIEFLMVASFALAPFIIRTNTVPFPHEILASFIDILRGI